MSDVSVRRLAVMDVSEDDNVWFIDRNSGGFEVQLNAADRPGGPFTLESDDRNDWVRTSDPGQAGK